MDDELNDFYEEVELSSCRNHVAILVLIEIVDPPSLFFLPGLLISPVMS